MGEYADLSVQRRDDGVVVVTLDNPAKRNAMSDDMTASWARLMRELRGDREARVLLVTGAGRAFCSGGDTGWIGSEPGASVDDLRSRMIRFYRAWLSVRDLEITTVAAVNGAALAGGFALALLCDLRLAAESASFGFPELPQGIPPSYAAARAALPAAVAAELTLTGRVLDAASAERLGAASSVHPDSELLPRALELASRIASSPPTAIVASKRRILLDREGSFGRLFAEEERALREALLGDEPDDAA